MNDFSTTFWMDFCIADRFGVNAILDTYRRSVRAFKNDVRYMADLVLVLNHKIWQHYEAGNNALAKIYDTLWRRADDFCRDNFKGEDAQYYYEYTD